MQKHRLLIVDDEPGIRRFLKAALTKDYHVTLAGSGTEALEIISHETFHIMITDQRMPGISGLELLERTREQYPDVAVILLTAYGTVNEDEAKLPPLALVSVTEYVCPDVKDAVTVTGTRSPVVGRVSEHVPIIVAPLVALITAPLISIAFPPET